MEENKLPVKIIVAAHKAYPMPDDAMYLPVHVGAEGKLDDQGNPLDLGYAKDNEGDHISGKNYGFCELTGLYWAWKNLDTRFLGLVHYRRYFCTRKQILSYRELEPLLRNYSVFVPRKRRYYIESLYSHYAHTHYAEHLDITREIVKEKYPEYLNTYDKVLRRTGGYMFNMFIMRKDYLDCYCGWLFDILFELEKRVDASSLSGFQARFFGRVSEILFNVWLEQMTSLGRIGSKEIRELGYVFTDKVNWAKKGSAFLKAKFLGKKYEESF